MALEPRDVPVSTLSVGGQTFNLAAGGAGFAVTRTGDLTPAIDVGYAVHDDTALQGTNYTASPTGVVHFASGQTTATIPMTILSNNFAQPTRAFTVDLTGVVDVLGPSATFAAKQDFATGSVPISVATADINGDGKSDLLIANWNVNTVSVLLNATDPGAAVPTFAAKSDFATGFAPVSVAAADVNGDGRPDLLVANSVPDSVSVFLNTTALGAAVPTFAAKADFATGDFPVSVAAADVNGDGRPDLMVANYSSNTVSVLLNTTAPGAAIPTFAAKSDFTTGNRPRSVASADVNGDGRPDLLVANSFSSTASVFINTTAPGAAVPTFAAKADFATGDFPQSVASADVNGDGRPDLLVANLAADTVSVLLNTTAPGAAVPIFAAKTDFATGDDPHSVTSADVNGDGRPDLLTANGYSNTVSVLLNTMAPGAAVPSFAATPDFVTGFTPRSITSADVNGDGRPDLIVSNSNADSVSVLLNTTSHAEATPSGTPEPVFLQAATPATGSAPFSVAVADVNGDGRPDLLVASVGTSSVSVLLNTTAPGAATPTFGTKVDFAVNLSPVSLSTADVNLDGKPDIVVVNNGSNNVSVLLNTTSPGATTPTFAAKADFATGSSPESVVTADVNLDGLPDLVIANTSAHTVSVLLNTTAPGAATPSFAAKVDLTPGNNPIAVTAADINGDGRPDLIAAHLFSGSASVLLNTTAPGASTPTFAASTHFLAGVLPNAVAAADVNGDGRPDLLVANNLSNNVSVLLNTTAPGATAPSFAPKQDFATGTRPFSVAAADVNGDGRPDLLVANNLSNNVSVLLNMTAPGATTPTFAAKADLATGNNPLSVAAADVNGDGRPDLLVANSTSDTVSVLVNTPAVLGAHPAAGTIDSAPVTLSLVRADPSPTSAATVHFTVTFSQAVSGLTAANFLLSGTGTAGASIGTPTTSDGGITWTVPLTTGADGTLGLTLADRTGISDSAGNKLYNSTADDGSTFNPVVGPQYTIDRTGPTATITSGPRSVTGSSTATFTFLSPDSDFDHFETQLDGSGFATATSPQTFTGLALGIHTFEVRAIDNTGNVGAPASYTWTVVATAGTVKTSRSGTTLYITGVDDLTSAGVLSGQNDQGITLTGGALGVVTVAGDGSTLIDGPTSFTGITNIKVDMRLGDDLVAADGLNLAGNLNVQGGGGNNVLLVGTPTGTTSLGSLTVRNGDGFDTVTVAGTTTLTGAMSINNGAGGSTITMSDTAAESLSVGSLSITNADGEDSVTIGGTQFHSGAVTINNGSGDSTVQILANAIDFTGAASVKAGVGRDTIVLGVAGGTLTGRSVSIMPGAGGSDISVDATTTLTGNLKVTAGSGFDKLDIPGALDVPGSVSISLADGGSETSISGPTADLGAVTVKATAGANRVDIDTAWSSRTVSLNLGNDGNMINWDGTANITGNVNITTGTAADDINLRAKMNPTGAVSVRTNAGDDAVDVTGAGSTIAGTLTIKTGDGSDAVALSGLTTNGAVTVQTGNSQDTVRVNDCTANGAVTLDSGASNDHVLIETQASLAATDYFQRVRLTLGSGDDTLDLGFNLANSVTFHGALSVDGGAGLDVVGSDQFANFLGTRTVVNMEVGFSH